MYQPFVFKFSGIKSRQVWIHLSVSILSEYECTTYIHEKSLISGVYTANRTFVCCNKWFLFEMDSKPSHSNRHTDTQTTTILLLRVRVQLSYAMTDTQTTGWQMHPKNRYHCTSANTHTYTKFLEYYLQCQKKCVGNNNNYYYFS